MKLVPNFLLELDQLLLNLLVDVSFLLQGPASETDLVSGRAVPFDVHPVHHLGVVRFSVDVANHHGLRRVLLVRLFVVFWAN